MSEFPYLVIDTRRAVETCEQGRAAMAALERMASLVAQQKRLLIQEVKRATGSKKDRARKELVELEKRRIDRIERRARTLLSPIREAAHRLAKEIADEQGSIPVFERSSLVVFEGEREITEEVVRRLDALGVVKA